MPRRPPTSPTVADSGAWERAGLQPLMRNLRLIAARVSWCDPENQLPVGTAAAFARTAPMADDRHPSMASIAPHVVSTCDLLPHPQHCNPTSIHAHLHSNLSCKPSAAESLHLDDNIFVDHCPCFANRKSHCITQQHTTSCLVNAELFCSCLLACPPSPLCILCL